MAHSIDITSIDDQIPLLPQTQKDEIEEGSKVDHSIYINQIFEKKFKDLDNSSIKSCTMFKVNVWQRESNPDAYTPKMVSIGPYHKGNVQLHPMEKYKVLFLRRFLGRKEGLDAGSCIKELEGLKEEALKCYDDVKTDEFCQMLLLDGCFVIEFIRERYRKVLKEEDKNIRKCPEGEDKIMNSGNFIMRDLILLENQLPFFVLDKLHGMTKGANEKPLAELARIIWITFFVDFPEMNPETFQEITKGNIKHLLHLRHLISCNHMKKPKEPEKPKVAEKPKEPEKPKQPEKPKVPPKPKELEKSKVAEKPKEPETPKQPEKPKEPPKPKEPEKSKEVEKPKEPEKLKQPEKPNEPPKPKEPEKPKEVEKPKEPKKLKQPEKPKEPPKPKETESPNAAELSKSVIDQPWHMVMQNATELSESGVSFAKATDSIEFENGLMKIPRFRVSDETETLLRNLIAFEHQSVDVQHKYFSYFAIFMDKLIESEKDVNLLCQGEIIENWLGDNKEVANLFNKIGNGVIIPDHDFYYGEVCKDVVRHCKTKWNKTKAIFWRNYFSSPCVGASTIAAILLLALTITQTILAFIDLLNK